MGRSKIVFGGIGLIMIPLLLISLPFFCIGAWEGAKAWKYAQTYETTEGEVVKNVLITSQDIDDFTRESSTYHPVITFRTADGGVKTFTAGGGSYPAQYDPGDNVTVLYDPANPSDAMIKSWEMWFLPILFMVIGLFPSIIGGGILLFIRFLSRKKQEQMATWQSYQ